MSQFGELLKEANSLGIEYKFDSKRKESFILTFRGKEWSRDNPAGLKGLMYGMIKAIKEGKL